MNEEMNQNVEAEEIKEAETVDGEVFEEDFVEENFLTKSKNWIKRNKKKLTVGGIAIVGWIVGYSLGGIAGYLLGGKTSDSDSSLDAIDLPPENVSEATEDSGSDEESDPE